MTPVAVCEVAYGLGLVRAQLIIVSQAVGHRGAALQRDGEPAIGTELQDIADAVLDLGRRLDRVAEQLQAAK